MADDDASKRLKAKMQPELDRMLADHDRFMQALAKMPEPSESDRRAIAEANSPEGWQRASDAVLAEVLGSQRRKVSRWPKALLIVAARLILGALLLIISN